MILVVYDVDLSGPDGMADELSGPDGMADDIICVFFIQMPPRTLQQTKNPHPGAPSALQGWI